MTAGPEQTPWHPDLYPTPAVMLLKDLDGPAPGSAFHYQNVSQNQDIVSYQLFALVMSHPPGNVQGHLSCLVSCEGKWQP